MDEFELIRQFFTRAAADSDVLIGIGDDGAVMRPEPGRDLISVVDTLVEGVHFPGDLNAKDIAYRAVAVNLSDIAAMAGRPRWMTLALTITEVDIGWLDGFSSGLFEAAAEHNVSLVGGDTTHGSQAVISVQIIGDVKPDAVLTRLGANVGDLICVSGTPGDAAAGLELLRSDAVSTDAADALARRFRRPTARIALAQAIAPWATSAIDVSDGLYGDTLKLLHSGGRGGEIAVDALPLSDAIQAEFSPEQAREFALGGGDDYELCFTVPADKESLLNEVAEQQGVPLTQIGVVTEGSDLICTDAGVTLDYKDTGYRHFGASRL